MANELLYGFYQLKDVANQRAIGFADEINNAITITVADHNAQINDLIGFFAERTTDYKRRFIGAASNRLQPGDENSRATPVKASSYDVSFPIQKGDTAWGDNFITRQKMTVGQVNNAVGQMLIGDVTWIRDHIMAALFYNGSGWTNADKEWGDLTIQGLANGDTTKYARIGGATAIDTHQLAQAANIADATNPYAVVYPELNEHPENAGAEYVSLIASNLVADTQALTPFVDISDVHVQPGSATPQLVGTPPQMPGSARLIGRTNNVWVAEYGWIPSGYMITVAVGGAAPPLRMREDPEPELQGFVRANDREDFPYREAQYFRRAGFGSWNRVGAVVTRIGNGTYAIPTNYGSPMY